MFKTKIILMLHLSVSFWMFGCATPTSEVSSPRHDSSRLRSRALINKDRSVSRSQLEGELQRLKHGNQVLADDLDAKAEHISELEAALNRAIQEHADALKQMKQTAAARESELADEVERLRPDNQTLSQSQQLNKQQIATLEAALADMKQQHAQAVKRIQLTTAERDKLAEDVQLLQDAILIVDDIESKASAK